MGRPPTRPKKLKDGWYVEVRNLGSKTGIKLRRDDELGMMQAVEEYGRSKDVIILGESKNGKWVNEEKAKKAAKAAAKKAKES
jgi:hypothetical protein